GPRIAQRRPLQGRVPIDRRQRPDVPARPQQIIRRQPVTGSLSSEQAFVEAIDRPTKPATDLKSLSLSSSTGVCDVVCGKVVPYPPEQADPPPQRAAATGAAGGSL